MKYYVFFYFIGYCIFIAPSAIHCSEKSDEESDFDNELITDLLHNVPDDVAKYESCAPWHRKLDAVANRIYAHRDISREYKRVIDSHSFALAWMNMVKEKQKLHTTDCLDDTENAALLALATEDSIKYFIDRMLPSKAGRERLYDLVATTLNIIVDHRNTHGLPLYLYTQAISRQRIALARQALSRKKFKRSKLNLTAEKPNNELIQAVKQNKRSKIREHFNSAAILFLPQIKQVA